MYVYVTPRLYHLSTGESQFVSILAHSSIIAGTIYGGEDEAKAADIRGGALDGVAVMRAFPASSARWAAICRQNRRVSGRATGIPAAIFANFLESLDKRNSPMYNFFIRNLLQQERNF